MLRRYYYLTKPGIIRGNLLTAAGGFLLASQGHIDAGLLLAVLAGTSLVIGSACVINNFTDRDIDARMARTKKRALVSGTVASDRALVFAALLGVLGFLVLGLFTNAITVAIGLVGFVDYVLFYALSKRRLVYGTLVGSVAGATAITAGYTAVTGRFDMGAWLLFMIMVFWQMPHFYAIAIRRLDDYKAAKLPVLPAVRGVLAAKQQIMFFIILFAGAVTLLTVFGYAGYTYLSVMTLLSLNWLRIGLQGFKTQDDTAWAKKMFLFSLVVLLGLSLTISIDTWVP